MSDQPDRNEIFQGSQPGIPTRNVMQEDFSWEVPVEAVPVPSEGKVYPANSPLHLCKVLEIKAMTAHEEDILTSRALIQQGSVIKNLIESCLLNKNIDVNEMLLGDKNAVMVAIRVTGYGADYAASVTCPSCSKSSSQNFNLSELEIKRLEIDPVAPGENLFSFRLPVTKKDVQFRFLTGDDENEINITSDRRRKMMAGGVGSNITTRLLHQIASVDGITDKNKLNTFVKNMPAQDSRRLRKYVDDHEPGIDMKAWMACSSCGTDSKVSLPLGSNFFWPE